MPEPPTERQLAFLFALGVRLDPAWNREQVSEQIEQALDTASQQPPTREQRLLVEHWGLDLPWQKTRQQFCTALFDAWEEDPQRDIPDNLCGASRRTHPADEQVRSFLSGIDDPAADVVTVTCPHCREECSVDPATGREFLCGTCEGRFRLM